MKIYRSKLHPDAPIYFGEASRDMLLAEVDELKPDRIFVITDRTVETLYADVVRELLPYASPSEVIVFNEGEENKNLATLQHVAGDLMRGGVTDQSLVLNLGGGGVLDMGGLAASLLGEGIRFAHVATTSNAMWQVVTDDRQAIHFVGGRNALGLHRAPVFSIADTGFLETEESTRTREALVEFAQLALVRGGEDFQVAQRVLEAKDAHLLPQLEATLEGCIETKLKTYESPAERAHAEVARQYGYPLAKSMQILAEGRLSLAEALYFGMRMAAEISFLREGMTPDSYARHNHLLDLLGIGVAFPTNVKIDRYIYQMHGNNKTLSDGNRMILLNGPGELAVANGQTLRLDATRTAAPGAEIEVTDAHVAEAFERIRLRG